MSQTGEKWRRVPTARGDVFKLLVLIAPTVPNPNVYSYRSQILVFFWLKSLKLRLSVDFQSIDETICHEKVVFFGTKPWQEVITKVQKEDFVA